MEKYEYTDEDLDKFMSTALALVHEAGKMITEAIGKTKAISTKVHFKLIFDIHLLLNVLSYPSSLHFV